MSAAGSLSPDPPTARTDITRLLREHVRKHGTANGWEFFADAVLALFGVPADVPTSTITRALAIAAAFDECEFKDYGHGFEWRIKGASYWYNAYAFMSHVRKAAGRAVGSPVPGDPTPAAKAPVKVHPRICSSCGRDLNTTNGHGAC